MSVSRFLPNPLACCFFENFELDGSNLSDFCLFLICFASFLVASVATASYGLHQYATSQCLVSLFNTMLLVALFTTGSLVPLLLIFRLSLSC